MIGSAVSAISIATPYGRRRGRRTRAPPAANRPTPTSGIPILILRGEQDNRTPAFRVDGLAGLDRVRNLEMPGDYFVFYEQEDVVLEEIDSFCGAH